MKYETKQKRIVLETLAKHEKGLTIKEILKELEDVQNEVSRATIYRQMSVLEEEGAVRTIKIGKSKIYQILSDNCLEHLHLVCEKCKKVVHLEQASSVKLDDLLLKDQNFVTNKVTTKIYGSCKDCLDTEN